jgi:hypothetical protein
MRVCLRPFSAEWSPVQPQPVAYRLQLQFTQSSEDLRYVVDGSTTRFVFPPEAQRDSPSRDDFQILVVALFADGERLVDGMALNVE